MSTHPPSLVVLAGPNGAGKSTSAPALLRGTLAVDQFVNADVIAQGLSGFSPESVALEAGRIMLQRIEELAQQRVRFAFETTLASRTLAPRISRLVEIGYRFHLVFLWLPSPEFAVRRVKSRAKQGGHDVPEETICRRFSAGLRNFFNLYQPLTTTWRMYNNSMLTKRRLIASGRGQAVRRIKDAECWTRLKEGYAHG